MNTNCVHYDFTECYEDQIATILQGEFDYQKIGAFCWNFNYQKGQGIESQNILSNRLDLLKKYFGYTIVTFNTENDISELLSWLTQKEVLVTVKSCKCPWDVNFNTEYNESHIITVKNYNPTQNQFICYDAWQQIDFIELNFQQFLEMYDNQYHVIFKKNQKLPCCDIQQSFFRHVSILFQNKIFNNIGILQTIFQLT